MIYKQNNKQCLVDVLSNIDLERKNNATQSTSRKYISLKKIYQEGTMQQTKFSFERYQTLHCLPFPCVLVALALFLVSGF